MIDTTNKVITLVWTIEDVQALRPTLSEDQAFEVLKKAHNHHDASIGVNWDVLGAIVQDLYGIEGELSALKRDYKTLHESYNTLLTNYMKVGVELATVKSLTKGFLNEQA